MLDPKVLQQAVELAPDWHHYCTTLEDEIPHHYSIPGDTTWYDWTDFAGQRTRLARVHADALAAELVRLVDAEKNYFFDSDRWGTAKLWYGENENMYRVSKCNDEDRTENTINAIVEFYNSGVTG